MHRYFQHGLIFAGVCLPVCVPVYVDQMKRYKKEQEDIKHLKAFISSCGTYSNLVKQAKSKQKILDKMEAAGLTEPVVEGPRFEFRFTPCEALPPPVMSFSDV